MPKQKQQEPQGLWYCAPGATHQTIGRYSDITGISEVQNLEAGMDFRRPEYRREVFLRFYECHLELRSHPGMVYLMMPYFYKKYKWGPEERLLFAFFNGCTQNPVMSKLIFDQFPTLEALRQPGRLLEWFNNNFSRLHFDTDRRHQKGDFLKSVDCYLNLCGDSQEDFFANILTHDDPKQNYLALWKAVREQFYSFGRLSSFSYLEYLRVMGLQLEAPTLFLEDMSGSKSHRNGLAKIAGRDDLDWHDTNPTHFEGKYTPAMLHFLEQEGASLLSEAKARLKDQPYFRDISYETLESACCTFKSHFRFNRRYAGVYIDMHYDRIKKAEQAWPETDFQDQWEARSVLPSYFLREKNPADPGVKSDKQNHFRNTGQIIMLDYKWPCFRNDWNRNRAEKQNQDY